MRQKKRAAAVLLSAVMAFSAVSPAVPVWAASWQKNASGSYIGSDGSVLTGILSRGIDVSQWQQNINEQATMMSLVLGGIAAISLLVGGIGIMNVLFVTVKERTKEIGLLKALGSSKKDILLQFLLEANFISLFGGIIGVLLSFILIPLISSFGTTIVQSAFNVVLALAFAIFTGTVFGFYPAWQAASLKPIEALNQE